MTRTSWQKLFGQLQRGHSVCHSPGPPPHRTLLDTWVGLARWQVNQGTPAPSGTLRGIVACMLPVRGITVVSTHAKGQQVEGPHLATCTQHRCSCSVAGRTERSGQGLVSQQLYIVRPRSLAVRGCCSAAGALPQLLWNLQRPHDTTQLQILSFASRQSVTRTRLMPRASSVHVGIRWSTSQYQARLNRQRKEAAKRDAQLAGKEYRKNLEIRAHTVRLVAEDGSHEVLPLRQAMLQAQMAGLDLIEINGTVDPPVCRIADHKSTVQASRTQAKVTRKKVLERRRREEIKEVHFRPFIAPHDLTVKLGNVTRFLDKGHRVKLVVRTQGYKERLAAADMLATLKSQMAGKAAMTDMQPRLPPPEDPPPASADLPAARPRLPTTLALMLEPL